MKITTDDVVVADGVDISVSVESINPERKIVVQYATDTSGEAIRSAHHSWEPLKLIMEYDKVEVNGVDIWDKSSIKPKKSPKKIAAETIGEE